VKDMTESEDTKYAKYCKKIWGIYALLVVVLIVILVALVATDNEERIFYALMTAAAAYVFRPTDRVINKYVLKLFGVSPPVKTDEVKPDD
jgi:hypothetical protein